MLDNKVTYSGQLSIFYSKLVRCPDGLNCGLRCSPYCLSEPLAVSFAAFAYIDHDLITLFRLLKKAIKTLLTKLFRSRVHCRKSNIDIVEVLITRAAQVQDEKLCRFLHNLNPVPLSNYTNFYHLTNNRFFYCWVARQAQAILPLEYVRLLDYDYVVFK